MKKLQVTCLLTAVFMLISSPSLLFAKPDTVGGENVPSGLIPQEIKNNKYPRTYFPTT